jgi:asparagine synthase (glutamine-hydrolysing)
MCGINGIVGDSFGVVPVLRERIVAMNDALLHRGPDDTDEFVDQGIALGHRRLSIIDLSDAGRQPMFNEDGSLVLVFNGEIYNYRELIAQLQELGHVFRSRSDSEVILHAYEQWGNDCVQRFNGMWAFALWDRRERRLILSRDRLGVKPLLYLEGDGRLLFSSELAGLRAVAPLHRANLDKLYSYLAYGYRTNDGQTMVDGVHELPPGHNAVYESGRLSLSRYWTLPDKAEPPPESERMERLRALLSDAVRLRFRSDVPVALLQSGGLDSSILCTIVNDEIAAERLGQTEVAAFTAAHPGHAFDESAAVTELMERCPHVNSVKLEPDSPALAERLPGFVHRMQEPMASPTSYAHESLMRAIRAQGIKVVINGQGADEAFAGYDTYIVGFRLLDVMLGRPSALVGEAVAMHRLMRYTWSHLIAQTAKVTLEVRSSSAAVICAPVARMTSAASGRTRARSAWV